MYPRSYRDLFTLVRRRPRMYLIKDDFPGVVAYVQGCDQGNASALLSGFREWLVVRAGGGSNLWWPALILRLLDPDAPPLATELDAQTDARAVALLFECLDEFLELRDEYDGLRRIHAAYAAWERTGLADWPRPRRAPEYQPITDPQTEG
ncbi:hypothetical protein [Actinoplanes sp. DH11]|uniref:hypothetical protein n=1 Tax=Actinoplanes sp. DH11 TaxID=2857011 RepID=UPI001E638D79|nr:hypothetical protein [Actinoplanes sp. DH11]